MELESSRCAAVILAAGGSSRFGGGPKQLAMVDGRPMVCLAVDAALGASIFAMVAVVAGAAPLGAVVPAEVALVDNPAWAAGQASSLQAGLRWARQQGFERVVVGLADQPGVTSEAWRLVATADDDHPIVVATYGGQRGNPVRLDSSIWEELPAEGDEGARALVRRSPGLVGLVPCPGTMVDIDTQEDLDRWN
jgi:hypothetical protein